MGDLQRQFISRYESILWSPMHDFTFPHKRPVDIIETVRVNSNKLQHPNQKPVKLLEKLIRCTTREGDTVLDFTMGSGSCGVACVNTNRNFIGIELDEGYFNLAKRRINIMNGVFKREDGWTGFEMTFEQEETNDD